MSRKQKSTADRAPRPRMEAEIIPFPRRMRSNRTPPPPLIDPVRHADDAEDRLRMLQNLAAAAVVVLLLIAGLLLISHFCEHAAHIALLERLFSRSVGL